MPTEEEILERKYEEFQRAQEFARPEIERARRSYTQSINGIWIGNAGAAITLFSVLASQPSLGRFLLFSLTCFVLALVTMGVGAALSLLQESARARRLEGINHIGDIRMEDVMSPTEAVGLSFRNSKTLSACISAVLFVLGCIIGLINLWS